MSISVLLSQYKSELSSIESSISPVKIRAEDLGKSSEFNSQYNNKQEHVERKTGHDDLNISQLNDKYESVEREIVQLKRAKQAEDKIAEINALITKDKSVSDLLDFQQIFIMFKSANNLIDAYPGPLQKTFSSKITQLHETLVVQLNDYLNLVVPDEHHIRNVFILQEFNSLVEKNSLKLERYKSLGIKWDLLADEISTGKRLSLFGGDDDEVVRIQATDSGDAFESFENLAVFIGKIGIDTGKRYVKISSNASKYLVKNISSVIRDPIEIKHLKQLSEVVLIEGISQDNIEADLQNIYEVSLVNRFIDRIKTEFANTSIHEWEDWKFSEEQKVDVEQEEEDNWDDGWDDEWDDDKDKKESKEDKAEVPCIKISKLCQNLVPVFTEYQKQFTDSGIFVTTVFALAIGKYPRVQESFLLYNDMNYLSQTLDVDDFKLIALREFNQSVLEHYKLIKDVIAKLLENETEGEEFDNEFCELDDTSLNLMGSLYQLFNGIFQLRETNAIKFKELVINLVECLNYSLIKAIIRLDDISEQQSVKFAHIIDYLKNVTAPFLESISEPRENIKSFNKLDNIKFLISNHLSAIMERFHTGEFRDVETAELCKVLQNVFEESELRDNYISEIVEFRS